MILTTIASRRLLLQAFQFGLVASFPRHTFALSTHMTSTDESSLGVTALNVQFTVRSEHRPAFLHEIRQDQAQTLANEPGALQFVIGENAKDPNKIHLHEQYRTRQDLDLHERTPHFFALATFLQDTDPLQAPPIIQVYQCQHEPVVIPPRQQHQEQDEIYCLNVESCIRPALRNEFVQLLTRHEQLSKAEPGCLQFDWGESVETPNTFYIHEEYRGKAGYDAHERTPHFDKFVAFNEANQPYSKPQVVSFYKTLE